MDPAQEIELNAYKHQEPMNAVIDRGDSDIQQFYNGATVFLTGGSGFLGKQLVEKLFRSCAIKKLYMLARSKRGKPMQERLNDIFKDPLYDNLRKKQPNFAEKIIPLEGDISVIKLGLSDKDWAQLTEEVDIIFHVAATIRFDEPLRRATFTNLRGTREALLLGKQCQKLKKFIHVSTAFCHATVDRRNTDVEEQFYPCPVPPETLISMAEEVDEGRLDSITKKLIEGWPNTYTFTKALAEELINRTAGDLPVCIVRPPIVLPCYYEPNPGWLDVSTVIGPSGVYLGGGMGFLRVFRTDSDMDLQMAPVDYVNNAIISAGWDSTVNRSADAKNIPIYTIVKKMRYGYIRETMMRHRHRLMSPMTFWWAGQYEVKSKFLYFLMSWYFHFIPAYIADFVVKSLGVMPKEIKSFVSVFKIVDKMATIYEYFLDNNWNFRDDHLRKMLGRMSDNDKAIFNCDVSTMDMEEYILVWGIGLRRYIIKDELKDTVKSHQKQQIYRVLHYILLTVYTYFLYWAACTIFSIAKTIFFWIFSV